MDENRVSVSDFKTNCLRLIESVRTQGQEYVITKHGKVVARLVPERGQRQSPRGSWKNRVRAVDDIIECDWSQEFEASRR